jgi:hypothetical protein
MTSTYSLLSTEYTWFGSYWSVPTPQICFDTLFFRPPRFLPCGVYCQACLGIRESYIICQCCNNFVFTFRLNHHFSRGLCNALVIHAHMSAYSTKKYHLCCLYPCVMILSQNPRLISMNNCWYPIVVHNFSYVWNVTFPYIISLLSYTYNQIVKSYTHSVRCVTLQPRNVKHCTSTGWSFIAILDCMDWWAAFHP